MAKYMLFVEVEDWKILDAADMISADTKGSESVNEALRKVMTGYGFTSRGIYLQAFNRLEDGI